MEEVVTQQDSEVEGPGPYIFLQKHQFSNNSETNYLCEKPRISEFFYSEGSYTLGKHKTRLTEIYMKAWDTLIPGSLSPAQP